MSHSPILLVHIWAGIVALPSGTAAMVFRKGSPRHVLAGKLFVASMLTLSIAGTYLAIVEHEPDSVAGGLLTFYMVATAWLTARREDGKTSRLDWFALPIPLVLGILTWITGLRDLRSGASGQDGSQVGMGLFMGSVMLMAAAGDVRMLLRGGLFGTSRIARHLWRMCFGLFIAAGSFFLGGNNRPLRLLSSVGIGQHLPQALFSVGLYSILTFLPLVLLIFWLIRVRFRNAYTGQAQSSFAQVPRTADEGWMRSAQVHSGAVIQEGETR
jgi:uncharacterized membrane protein